MTTLFTTFYAVVLNENKRVLSYASTRKGAEARLKSWTRYYPSQQMHIEEYNAWREKPATEYAEQMERELK